MSSRNMYDLLFLLYTIIIPNNISLGFWLLSGRKGGECTSFLFHYIYDCQLDLSKLVAFFVCI